MSILKPDCIERNMEGTVRRMLTEHGFLVLLEKRTRLSLDDVSFIYERCVGEDFFKDFAAFLTSGDVVVLVLSNPTSKNVIKDLNSLVGHTNPQLAKDYTIRKLGESVRRNLVHSSADPPSFWREASRMFSEKEMCDAGLE
ncbi:MAG: hypothetical protein HYU81_01150 [Candidatus Brennerbacteria bacterium]|nr:hypothetical protein [Candidatus Brennerbacteria bacterium]